MVTQWTNAIYISGCTANNLLNPISIALPKKPFAFESADHHSIRLMSHSYDTSVTDNNQQTIKKQDDTKYW